MPGAEKFVVLNRMYLRDTNAALIVYDVNSTESLKQAQVWVEELKEYAPSEVVISLTGNKMDTSGAHAVGQQDGQNFARKNNISVCKRRQKTISRHFTGGDDRSAILYKFFTIASGIYR